MEAKTKVLKALKKADNVTMVFGEWFDKQAGNTYYDVEIMVGDKSYEVASRYGYNAGDKQSIDEGLAAIGYRVRINKVNRFAPYSHIHQVKTTKLKRELFK